MRFTDFSIRNLRSEAGRKLVLEDNTYGHGSLGVRVSPNGSKTWVHVYKIDGRQRMVTLGRYPAMSLAQAHEAFGDASMKLAADTDPALEVLQEHARRTEAPTVAHLATDFIDKYAQPRKRSWREDERILQRDVVPIIGTRKAEDIRRRDITALLDRVMERGSPTMANRTLACVRKLFNWAVQRGVLEHSPCALIEAPAREEGRDRVLSDDEIGRFVNRLPTASMDESTRLALLFTLATAQRSGEVVRMTWRDVDLKSGLWTIPSTGSKNRLAHRVPLNQLAMDVLRHARRRSEGSGPVFPGRSAGSALAQTSLTKAITRNLAHFEIEAFGPHDLRRTAATQMTGVGVTRMVLAKVLNHAEPGVTAVYDRHGYDAEKRDALTRWGEQLERLVVDFAA